MCDGGWEWWADGRWIRECDVISRVFYARLTEWDRKLIPEMRWWPHVRSFPMEALCECWSKNFSRLSSLPDAQPTVSQHCRHIVCVLLISICDQISTISISYQSDATSETVKRSWSSVTTQHYHRKHIDHYFYQTHSDFCFLKKLPEFHCQGNFFFNSTPL